MQETQMTVKSKNGFLRLFFSRSFSRTIFGCSGRKEFSLKMPDSPENQIVAQQIAIEIANDIRAGKFVKDLNYYLPENRLKRQVGIAYDPKKIKVPLLELYLKWFKEVKIHDLRPKGQTEVQYKKYLKHIENCPQDLNDQEAIVNYIASRVDWNNAKRICALFEDMFNWARRNKKYNFIYKDINPEFKILYKEKGMKASKFKPGMLVYDLMPHYVHNYRIKAFTEEEMYAIINAFYHRAFVNLKKKDGRGLTLKERTARTVGYYFVVFKFLTGVRTGEASALQFCDIADDNSYINIRHMWDSVNRKLKRCLKTEAKGEEGTHARKLMCDENLAVMIEKLKKEYYTKPTDYVFRIRESVPFSLKNIQEQWYGDTTKKVIGVIPQLMMKNQVSVYLRPYNTRHTWINRQIIAGTNPLHVCYCAGNTTEVMEMYYLSQPRPEDIDLKAKIDLNLR